VKACAVGGVGMGHGSSVVRQRVKEDVRNSRRQQAAGHLHRMARHAAGRWWQRVGNRAAPGRRVVRRPGRPNVADRDGNGVGRWCVSVRQARRAVSAGRQSQQRRRGGGRRRCAVLEQRQGRRKVVGNAASRNVRVVATMQVVGVRRKEKSSACVKPHSVRRCGRR